MKTVGVYTRVSSQEQDADNQILAIEHYCQAQGWNITAIYTESESAWVSGHQHELARFLDVLESGKRHFDIFLIFALDRLSREGVARTFGLVNRIEARGCHVVSMKEPWAAADNPMRDVFLAITAWAAKYESDRKSQNTKIGLAKAIAKGVKLGRPKGRKDDPDKPRRRAGYLLRYADKAARDSFIGSK
jgi:DNA invertase Pin-like site-specific DNA recombinase